jgi:hypothetical protein
LPGQVGRFRRAHLPGGGPRTADAKTRGVLAGSSKWKTPGTAPHFEAKWGQSRVFRAFLVVPSPSQLTASAAETILRDRIWRTSSQCKAPSSEPSHRTT